MTEHSDYSQSSEVTGIGNRIRTQMLPVRESIGAAAKSKDIIIPDYKAPSVKEIDFRYLHNRFGTDVALLDVDNTLTSVGGKSIDVETAEYLQELKQEGSLTDIYLATRSGRDLSWLEETLGAKRFHPPKGVKKPQQAYFQALLDEADREPGQTVMVGDRLTHDIRGAEEAGLVTVLVDPIGKGWIKGWIPTDFLGIYQKEQNALKALRQELSKLSSDK